MAKTQSRKTASRSAMAPKRAKSARRASTNTAKVASVKKSSSAPARSLDQPVKHRAGSKQARVIEMLTKPEGTTIDDIMKVAGISRPLAERIYPMPMLITVRQYGSWPASQLSRIRLPSGSLLGRYLSANARLTMTAPGAARTSRSSK